MMNIRKVKYPSDIESIKELCEKHGLTVPDIEYCLVAEDEKGNVLGFANIITIPTVDCFVAESPTVARRLFDSVVGGAIASNQRAVQFYTKREDVIDLYKHLNFNIQGQGYTIARKEV